MILDRLRVRGKLNFLLVLPLAAVILVAIPFVSSQIEDARSAATTADAAHNARQLGGLVWELQRERLLTASYLASPTDDGVKLLLQQQAVGDTAESVRASLGSDASDELVEALARVESLTELREGALARGVSLESVARTFHAVIGAVIDALRLVSQRTSDAEGTRQLSALDALLRANEESALRGMALIAAAVSPKGGLRLLADSSAQAQMFTVRFVQHANVEQAGLVVQVDQGEAGRSVEAMVDTVSATPGARRNRAFVADALAGVDAQSALRRLVQDRVTREIADAAAGRATDARSAAWTVGLGTAVLFLLVMVLAVVISRSIARPLQRLTLAAATVADVAKAELLRVADSEHADEEPPRVAAIDVASGDEVGDLAAAFNRVQSTAAMLLERQLVTRRNVSLIFANVAQRTQNLVGRQLVVIDELERDEQNTQLLTKLYRLDHLSTRLRRNAKNLLVVAGARDEAGVATPTPLATALRAALAEIEDYQRVRMGAIPDITVAPQLLSDLVLVFAELLENATSFSPPDSSVDIHVALAADGGCEVTVVDHGIGMAPDRLAEENHRMVERERLDIAPTSVLGLFVVGRLGRRHGLAVELAATPGGGITAKVGIPSTLAELITTPDEPASSASALPDDAPAGQAKRPVIPTSAIVIPEALPDDTFSWFAPEAVNGTTADESAEADLDAEAARNGLTRRLPGTQLPSATSRPIEPAMAARPAHDAAATRASLDDYQSAIARAAPPSVLPVAPSMPTSPAPAAGTPSGRGGLARRVPGAHLATSLRQTPSAQSAPCNDAPAARNPELDRAVFNAYAAGLARADAAISPGSGSDEGDHDPTKENHG
jgi:signal transduction histidine kinase